MDAFYERLLVRAATIDELLSDDFEALPGQKDDAELAARRLAAWCRASASGDWSLFGRRLERDGLTIGQVLGKFATVRRRVSASRPQWIDDAMWIEAALRTDGTGRDISAVERDQIKTYAFQQLLTSVVEQADARLWSGISDGAIGNLEESARISLRLSLLEELSKLCAPALYELFARTRDKTAPTPESAGTGGGGSTSRYDRFISDMKQGGLRSLFEDKPVLLRLIALLTRQWIETSRELITRLDDDIARVRQDILGSEAATRVAGIESDLSDRHNGGHSVRILVFNNGSRVLYKPKDLRLDVSWHALVERLNRSSPPMELKAVRAIAKDGYGWTEFIDHTGCDDQEDCRRFFQRTGGWLALFHCFSATDMHQENMIAAGAHPVPVDVEMLLQSAPEEHFARYPEEQAFKAAVELLANSVMMVGLVPSYRRTPDNNIYSVGGLTEDWGSRTRMTWRNVNSDDMRLARVTEAYKVSPNTPHIAGQYVKFGNYIDDFISGFEAYAKFIRAGSQDPGQGGLFDGFAGVPVRKVIRYTRFYHMLLQRLKDHRTMDDGVMWSAQADFIARFADWDAESDPRWPLQAVERASLMALDVPHFVSPSDRNEVSGISGPLIQSHAVSGLDRARARLTAFDQTEIDWQTRVIRENTSSIARAFRLQTVSVDRDLDGGNGSLSALTAPALVAKADEIAQEISRQAIRRGPGAAWIGLDWLGDSEYFQLSCLGPDIYNGASGIGVFLAAHFAVAGRGASGELALAAVANLRKNLHSNNAARIARSLGVGGAIGLGSIVYSLAVMSKSLGDRSLVEDAHVAAELFSDDLIAADKQLDILGGSAGAILSLLRLYRDTRSETVLRHARRCGEHLLAQSRLGGDGLRSWAVPGFGQQALNGMSHGAAGFAYALASLAVATGREEFARAASECIAFENSSYDPDRHNWPDLRRAGHTLWPSQWCHGAVGIGLARIASAKFGDMDAAAMKTDIQHALEGARYERPTPIDTLCCGTLGRVELFRDAGDVLDRSDLRELASRQLLAVLDRVSPVGEGRSDNGDRRFNLSLFRGLAGVGYVALRQVDPSLPNILIWE